MAAATARGDVAGTVPHVWGQAVDLRHIARHCVRRPRILKSGSLQQTDYRCDVLRENTKTFNVTATIASLSSML